MRRYALVLILFLTPFAFAADTGGGGGGEKPISFNIGPEQSGGMGASLKGASYRSFCEQCFGQSFFPKSMFAQLSPDFNFSSDKSTGDHGAVSVRLLYQIGYLPPVIPPKTVGESRVLPIGPWFIAYADGRRQYGSFQQANGTVANVNATLVGGAVALAVPYITRSIQVATKADPFSLPMVHFAWYHPVTQAGTQSLPDGVIADTVMGSLKFALPLTNDQKANITTRLDFSADWSHPTSGAKRGWKHVYDIALSAKVGTSDFRPVLTYTSGQKFGLKYDKQVILGIAMDLVSHGQH